MLGGIRMRWFLRIVVGLIMLLVVITGVLYIMGTAKLNQRYSIAEPALAIPTDAASIARGRHLVVAITKCEDCHAAGLRGSVFLDVPPFRLIAPNLTRGSGGIGASLTDTDYIRAIRDGVGPDGRGLLVMPTASCQYLSDAHLADIIMYVKSRPAIDNHLPETESQPAVGSYLVRRRATASARCELDRPLDDTRRGNAPSRHGGLWTLHRADRRMRRLSRRRSFRRRGAGGAAGLPACSEHHANRHRTMERCRHRSRPARRQTPGRYDSQHIHALARHGADD